MITTSIALRSTLTAIVLFFLALPSPALAEGPMATLKRTQSDIDKLLAEKVVPGSDKEKAVNDKITARVNAFINYKELSRRSLAKHWDQRSAQEQEEFVSLLRDLIERNYVKQLRKAHGKNLEYRGEKITGDKALVETAVPVKKKRGRTATIVIAYKMQKVGKVWMVYDVVTDEVSIVRNYKAQFNKIIRKNSYEHLVKKMRKKAAKGQTKNS